MVVGSNTSATMTFATQGQFTRCRDEVFEQMNETVGAFRDLLGNA